MRSFISVLPLLAAADTRSRSKGPDLDNDPPPVGDSQSLAVVRRPSNILDRDMSKGFLAQFEEVHAGGALPNLFPDDVKKGDFEVVRYLDHEVVVNEGGGKKKGNKTFVSLKFEVLDVETGKVSHKAQQVCNTVMMDYFGISEDEEGEIVYDPKTMRAKSTATLTVRDPKTTPLLTITYGGEGQQATSGFSKPKLFIISELRQKDSKKKN